MLICCVICI
jgi:hypothetical protein